MVQILPILAAATLLAQSAFGAAVPVKRTSHEASNNNQYESNRNQESNQYNQNEYQYNQYDQAQQQQQQQNNQHEQNQYENQYQNNEYQNEYNQAQQNNQHENNQYENEYQNEYQQQQQQQHEVTTTLAHEVTSTAEAHPVETTILHQQQQQQEQEQQYGSGSSNWNGYNDCVNTCMAQFGAPPSAVPMNHENIPEAPINANANPSGAIHTVMVAPDGVGLRYVPFAVNASVGDTVRYVWTTNANHTVTLSSALTICNRSALAEERNFASGVRSASAGTQTFDVVVETEEPQFFYCSVAQHCIKGMFGIINPGSDYTGSNTVRTYMSTMLDSNPQWAAANEYIRQNISAADNSALTWGNDISLEGLSEEQRSEVVSNVMFTRAVFGANPGMADLDQGAATPDGSPIMIPQGLNVLLSNTALNPPTTSIEAGSFPTPTGTGTIVAPLANGAFSVKGGASGVWVAAFVGVLGYLLI